MDFGFAWSCNCAVPDWEQPDTVTITGLAADSLKNTSVGFANGQPSFSSSNTVAVDPEVHRCGRGAEEADITVMIYLLYSLRGGYYQVCFLARTDRMCNKDPQGKPSSRVYLANQFSLCYFLEVIIYRKIYYLYM